MQTNPTDLTIEFSNTSITLTDQGVVLKDDMSYEEWHEGLRIFKWGKERMDLGFAGYLKFGDLKFGKEKVGASLGQLEFDLGDVTTAMYVNTVPDSLRKDNLSTGHYVVLARAGITPKQMEKWSDIASEQKLSPSQLKASIQHGEVIDPSVVKQQTHGILTIHGISQEFDVWMRRVGGKAGIGKMSDEAREEIAGELEKFAELYEFVAESLAQIPSA